MKQRQTRDTARLGAFRMLDAGEVDHEIDTAQLLIPPAPVWDAATVAACASIYDRYVRPGSDAAIPRHLFYDLPRRTFLEYAVRFGSALLVGSNDPQKAQLEPVVLSQNIREWATPRHYAFASGTEALFYAILDTGRLKALDFSSKSVVAMPAASKPAETDQRGFYFGVDYRALPHAPWRSGAVYLYARSAFPDDFETIPFLAETPIRPLAKVCVDPWDWPFLDRVCGANIAAQTERQWDTFLGYPWSQDPDMHPHRGMRPLMRSVRDYLDADCTDPADLGSLGRRFGIGPFVLLRQFRAQFGLSPHTYQTLSRIHHAKRLLAAGLPIAQTAVESGFCDQTHLTRHFRTLVGLTPGQYVRAQEYPID